MLNVLLGVVLNWRRILRDGDSVSTLFWSRGCGRVLNDDPKVLQVRRSTDDRRYMEREIHCGIYLERISVAKHMRNFLVIRFTGVYLIPFLVDFGLHTLKVLSCACSTTPDGYRMDHPKSLRRTRRTWTLPGTAAKDAFSKTVAQHKR
jgi:hypothetical protein